MWSRRPICDPLLAAEWTSSTTAASTIRGGEPVLVTEHSATQTLRPWDRIAARIVRQGSKMILAGGLLVFTLEASQSLFAQLRNRQAHAARVSRKAALSLDALDGWNGTDEDLRREAPLFTTTWLSDVLPRALGTSQPTLFNSEGDEVSFHTVIFPFTSDASREEIARRLGDLHPLRRETPTFWNWVGQTASRPAKSDDAKAVMWNVTMEDGSVVLGNVELKERTVSLSVNSAARAERGRIMVANALGGNVGVPLTEIQTVEQMKAAPRPTKRHPAAEIPPEVRTELVHAMLDKQYRALLDEPVSMIGDISPRAAARSARGRRNLAVWLKHLENRSRSAPDQNGPMATYDFTWLWRELKIEQLRN
jgi:hypothetical protein